MKKKIILALSGIVIISAVAFTGYKLLHKTEYVNPDAVPTEQALEELKGYRFGTYDNIRFDCEVSEAGKVYERLDVPSLKDIDKELETMQAEGADMLKLFSDFDIDKSQLKEDEELSYQRLNNPDKVYSVQYSKDNEWVVSYYYSGAFAMTDMRGEAEPMGEEGAAIVKRFRPSEITEDITYKVGGEYYTLKDAIAFTDSRLSQIKDKYLGGNMPVLGAAAVVHSPEADEYSYILKYYATYEGVCFDDCGSASPYEDYLAGRSFLFEIRHRDKFFIAHTTSSDVIDKKEAKNIIPLSEAEKLAAEVLAAKADITVTECGLKYVCITHYDTEERSCTPMWVFTIEGGGEIKRGDEDSYRYATDPFEKNTFYVDAITGDYYLYQYHSNWIFKNGDEEHALGQDREHEKSYEDY